MKETGNIFAPDPNRRVFTGVAATEADPEARGMSGVNSHPCTAGTEGGMSWESQVLGYRGCRGRPGCWEARPVLGEISEHRDQGMHRDTHFHCKSQIYSNTGCPTALVWSIPLQCGPQTRSRALLGAEALHQQLSRGDQTSTSPFYQQYPQFPHRRTVFGTRSGWQRPGQAQGAGSEPSPPLGLPGHAERHIRSSGPGASGMPPLSAPHRGLIPLLGHPRAKKYNTCRIRV